MKVLYGLTERYIVFILDMLLEQSHNVCVCAGRGGLPARVVTYKTVAKRPRVLWLLLLPVDEKNVCTLLAWTESTIYAVRPKHPRLCWPTVSSS